MLEHTMKLTLKQANSSKGKNRTNFSSTYPDWIM